MKTCKIVRHGRGEGFRGKQGLNYFSGISAESAGSRAICMHLLVMPPGAEAKPHYHEAHETAIYMLEGASEFRHGPNLENLDRVEAGDFIYIPAGVPHQPFNPTDKPAKALIARTDPNEQESVVLLT
ncbi:cupin domain-containing protein [Taklimakanibacter lacteus]|uniref:cupin domain-containing protein n=1 Tax=Taklimakanibacter lacteus TaxID=2268456 RepID=UPI000E66EECC